MHPRYVDRQLSIESDFFGLHSVKKCPCRPKLAIVG